MMRRKAAQSNGILSQSRGIPHPRIKYGAGSALSKSGISSAEITLFGEGGILVVLARLPSRLIGTKTTGSDPTTKKEKRWRMDSGFF